MREIKFKAWDSKLKRFSEMPLYNPIIRLNNNDIPERDILLQYTGIKDKNGIEIYEGDIIKHHYGATNHVWYKNGAFVLSCQNSNINLLYDLLIIDGILQNFEVIGNIYENEDLLHNM